MSKTDAPKPSEPAPPLPQAGGAWVRLPDGTLVPEAPDAEPPKPPLKDA